MPFMIAQRDAQPIAYMTRYDALVSASLLVSGSRRRFPAQLWEGQRNPRLGKPLAHRGGRYPPKRMGLQGARYVRLVRDFFGDCNQDYGIDLRFLSVRFGTYGVDLPIKAGLDLEMPGAHYTTSESYPIIANMCPSRPTKMA